MLFPTMAMINQSLPSSIPHIIIYNYLHRDNSGGRFPPRRGSANLFNVRQYQLPTKMSWSLKAPPEWLLLHNYSAGIFWEDFPPIDVVNKHPSSPPSLTPLVELKIELETHLHEVFTIMKRALSLREIGTPAQRCIICESASRTLLILILESSRTYNSSSSLKATKQGLGQPKNNSVWPMSAESPDPIYFSRV